MRQQARRKNQRGVSALLIIGVLVMLGGLIPYAFGLLTSVNSGHARELSAARAEQAAQAGLDWGRFRVRTGVTPQCTALQNITTLPGSLQPYTVTVRCTTSTFPEGGLITTRYRIQADACNVPQAGACPNANASADYVQRTAVVTVP
jgi:MSHA biogenesis protein MshP